MKRVKLPPGSKKPIEQNSSRPFLASKPFPPKSLRGRDEGREFTKDVNTCNLPDETHDHVDDAGVEGTISCGASPQSAEGHEGTDLKTPERLRCAPSEVERVAQFGQRPSMSMNTIANEVLEVCDALSSGTLGLKEATTVLSAVDTPDLLRRPFSEDKEGTERLFDSARKLWNFCVTHTNSLLTGVTKQVEAPHGLTESLEQQREAAKLVTSLRRTAADLIECCLPRDHITNPDAQIALSFTSKVACLYHEEGEFNKAATMFARASKYSDIVRQHISLNNNENHSEANTQLLLSQVFDLLATEASNAWHLSDIDRCHLLLDDAYAVAIHKKQNEASLADSVSKLVLVRLFLGKSMLEVAGQNDPNQAVKFLDGAVEILSKHLPSWMTEEYCLDDPDNAVACGDENSQLALEVHRYLACARLSCNLYDATTECIETIRNKVATYKPSCMTPSLDFTLSYLSFQAHLQSASLDQAFLAVEKILQSPIAPLKSCTRVLIEYIQAAPGLRTEAIELFASRVGHPSADDSEVSHSIDSVLEALIETAKYEISDDTTDAILRLASKQNLLASQGILSRAHILIFNHATAMFKAKRFHLACKLYQCSEDFNRDANGSNRPRAQLLRLQARCQVGSGLFEDALATITTVESLESPLSPSTLLIKFRILLRLDGKENELDELLKVLFALEDVDFLIAAAHEAETQPNHAIASTVLFELHRLISEERDDGPLHDIEILVFRLAVYHLTNSKNAGESSAVRIGKLFQLLVDRLKQTKGMQTLSETDGEYFTSVAWNTGLDAAKKGEKTPAAVCFSTCAFLIPFFFPDTSEEGHPSKSSLIHKVRKASALLLVGACILDLFKEQFPAISRSGLPKNAQNLLHQARGALTKLLKLVDVLIAEGYEVELISRMRVSGLILTHELLCLEGNDTPDGMRQLQLMQTPYLSVKDILLMASISAKHGSTEAASRALDIALDTMLQASIRDEDTIAAIVRNRIEIDESGKAEELLKSAATNLAQLQSYPADEAAWLVTTSFNRGVAHHRMGRIEKAAHAFVISQELVCHAKKFDPTLVRLESRIREARAAVEPAPAAIQ